MLCRGSSGPRSMMMIITGADMDRIRVALAVTQSCRWPPESLAAVGGRKADLVLMLVCLLLLS